MSNGRRGSVDRRSRNRRLVGALLGVAIASVAMLAATGASAGSARPLTKGLWTQLQGKPKPVRAGAKAQLRLDSFRSFRLERSGLAKVLRNAPLERTKAASSRPIIVSLPAPRGGFQSFALTRSQIMAPGLARKHPEIKTWAGRGITDPAATIHADLSQLGFHASVRSPQGAWYIDPYYRGDQSLYVSYYGRDVASPRGTFVERDAQGAELSVDKGYYHAADTVTVSGSGYAHDASVTITITDPDGQAAPRTLTAQSNGLGNFERSFVADPDGLLGTRYVEATDGDGSAASSYQIVRDDDPTSDPPTGDFLRIYRLGLITDPGYSAYHGGPANVTAAKVALMNRVSQ